MVRVGYVFDIHLGGGKLSLILCNLVLHELDCFVEKLITYQGFIPKRRFSPAMEGIVQPINSEYALKETKVGDRIAAANSKTILRAKVRQPYEKRKLESSAFFNDTMPEDTRGVVKLYYVRFVDEWLIGVSCMQSQAVVKIKSKIKEFFSNELLLELSEDKIMTTKAVTSKVKFLETELSSVSSVRGKIKHYRNIRGDQGSTLVPPIMMRMDAPHHLLVNKLINKGIAKIGKVSGGKTGIVPQPILKYSNLPINEIILRYRVILNEVFNYYSFVDNRPRLIVVYWILRKSLAKTLATKLKLKSSRQVYLKFGINIKYTIPNTGVSIDFASPSLAVSPNNFTEATVPVFSGYPLSVFPIGSDDQRG